MREWVCATRSTGTGMIHSAPCPATPCHAPRAKCVSSSSSSRCRRKGTDGSSAVVTVRGPGHTGGATGPARGPSRELVWREVPGADPPARVATLTRVGPSPQPAVCFYFIFQDFVALYKAKFFVFLNFYFTHAGIKGRSFLVITKTSLLWQKHCVSCKTNLL